MHSFHSFNPFHFFILHQLSFANAETKLIGNGMREAMRQQEMNGKKFVERVKRKKTNDGVKFAGGRGRRCVNSFTSLILRFINKLHFTCRNSFTSFLSIKFNAALAHFI